MELDDNFDMIGTVGNISLIQKVPYMKLVDPKKKDGEKVPAVKEVVSSYGTPYQALQGYAQKSIAIDLLKNPNTEFTRKIVKTSVMRVLKTLDDLEAEIKEKFCTYVKTCKG